MPRQKKVVENKRVEYTEDESGRALSFHQLINEYLDGDETHAEEIKKNLYRVRVDRLNDGKRAKLTAIFSNIETLLTDIQQQFGGGSYELFINITLPDNKTTFTKYRCEIDGETEPEYIENTPEPRSTQPDLTTQLLLTQLQSQQAMMTEMIKSFAMMKVPNSPVRSSLKEVTELLELIESRKGDSGGEGDEMMSMLKPLLISSLMKKNGEAPAQVAQTQ